MTTVPIPQDRIPPGRSRERDGVDPLRTASAGGRFGVGTATVMTTTERALERSLALEHGLIVCPRRGSVGVAACDDCPYFCRTETESSSVICSYPIPARETSATRSRGSAAMRIALRHQSQRT